MTADTKSDQKDELRRSGLVPNLSRLSLSSELSSDSEVIDEQDWKGSGSLQQQSHPQERSGRCRFWFRLLLAQVFLQLVAIRCTINASSAPLVLDEEVFPDQDCIYVKGGGFSGFPFIHGRLQTLEDPWEHQYLCYSAGCFVVYGTLCNQTYEEMHGWAQQVQHDFRQGDISRYQVVESFIDDMMRQCPDESAQRLLSKMNVVTSIPYSGGFQAHMEQPKSQADMRKLLLQTAWIPTVTGSQFTLDGHMDGVFSKAQHPTCQKKVGITFRSSDILWNMININIAPETVERLWKLGKEYGM